MCQLFKEHSVGSSIYVSCLRNILYNANYHICQHQHILLRSAEAVWLAPAAPQAAGTRVHRLVLDLCSLYRFDMSRHGHIFSLP